MELDREQQEIVEYEGSQVVVAGPGSGKTRTLVAKAEKLWKENKDIICLTFTRSAAKEMRDRMPGVEARTIHSYCHSVIGWTGDYNEMLAAVLYGKKIGVFKDKFEVVLVDEVQDLTEVQWEVVSSLIGKYLFAVGDPYQSIYGWSGALGSRIIRKLDEFGCKKFYLHNNYRSCPGIIKMLEHIYRRDLVSAGVRENGLTAILTRTRRKLRELAELLEGEGIGFTVRYAATELDRPREEFHGSDKLKLMTCHCSKGLEFDKVVLYAWSPEPFGEEGGLRYPSTEETNLEYVSIARASKDFRYVDGNYNDELLEVLSD
jgi:superfamily I DNA/RNA helicase